MGINPMSENSSLSDAERDLEILRAAITIARLVKPFSCAERQRIEIKVREIIR